MSSLPKISVIIPSLNKVKFIEKTLQSIVDQQYPNLEVIVMDGGSTDGTMNVIKKYAKENDFIRYESKKDKGQVEAVNEGLKEAEGELLTFINADDFYQESALSSVAKAYQQNPKALWFAGRGVVVDYRDREMVRIITFYKNFLLGLNKYKYLLIVNYLMQPSVFITRNAFKKFGEFEGDSRGSIIEYKKWLEIGQERMPHILKNTLSSFRLTKKGLSANLFKTILAKDYQVAAGFTKNPVLLFLHQMHNYGRVALVYLTGLKKWW